MNSEEKESTILRFVKEEEEEKDEDWAMGDESDNGWRSVKRRKERGEKWASMVEDVEEEEEEEEEAEVEVEEEDEWE